MSHTRRVPSSAPVATMWGWVGWMARHWRADRSPVLTVKEDNYIYFRNKCIQLGFMLTVGKVWQANLTNDGRPTLWADQLSWRRPPHFASRKTQRSSCNCRPFLNETKYNTVIHVFNEAQQFLLSLWKMSYYVLRYLNGSKEKWARRRTEAYIFFFIKFQETNQ